MFKPNLQEDDNPPLKITIFFHQLGRGKYTIIKKRKFLLLMLVLLKMVILKIILLKIVLTAPYVRACALMCAHVH